MACKIVAQGNYELFCTPNNTRILRIDGDNYAIVEGQKGELIVGARSDQDKQKTLQHGSFKLIDFDNDAKFNDIPHLFLEKGQSYQEAILPNGLPSNVGDRKKFVSTDETIGIKELESYLQSPTEGEGSARSGRPGGGSIANATHYLSGVDFSADKDELIDHAVANDAPSEVLEQLDKLEAKNYESMAGVSKTLGKQIQKQRPPIEDYDRKNVDEILEALDDLDKTGIEKVRKYEESQYGRKQILRKTHHLLEDSPVEDYFDLSADELRDRIDDMEPAELKKLERYETEHKNRKTVLEAIERRSD